MFQYAKKVFYQHSILDQKQNNPREGQRDSVSEMDDFLTHQPLACSAASVLANQSVSTLDTHSLCRKRTAENQRISFETD
jgi:hypothetical protein